MIGASELHIHHVGIDTFYVVRYNETIDGQLEVGIGIPRNIGVSAAWYRIFRIVRSDYCESFRNIFIRKSFCPAVIFAGHSENLGRVA